MNTISLRMNDEDTKLLRDYVSVNKLNMSQFIRELIMDKLEEEFELDEREFYMLMKRLKVRRSMTIRKFGRCWAFNYVQGRVFRISSKKH